jgi:hypothetical protein
MDIDWRQYWQKVERPVTAFKAGSALLYARAH